MQGGSNLQRLYIIPTSKMNDDKKSTSLSVWTLAGGIIFIAFGLTLMYLTMHDNAHEFVGPAVQNKSARPSTKQRLHRLESDEKWELCE